jgi:hypothetical protein
MMARIMTATHPLKSSRMLSMKKFFNNHKAYDAKPYKGPGLTSVSFLAHRLYSLTSILLHQKNFSSPLLTPDIHTDYNEEALTLLHALVLQRHDELLRTLNAARKTMEQRPKNHESAELVLHEASLAYSAFKPVEVLTRALLHAYTQQTAEAWHWAAVMIVRAETALQSNIVYAGLRYSI